jgi:hypothetical protein
MPSKKRPIKSHEAKLPLAGNEDRTVQFTGSAGVARRGKIFEAAHNNARGITGGDVMPEKGGVWFADQGKPIRAEKATSNKRLSKVVKTDLRNQIDDNKQNGSWG